MPLDEFDVAQRSCAALSHECGHARLAHPDGTLAHAARVRQLWIEPIDAVIHLSGIRAEDGRVGPRRHEVASRDDVA